MATLIDLAVEQVGRDFDRFKDEMYGQVNLIPVLARRAVEMAKQEVGVNVDLLCSEVRPDGRKDLLGALREYASGPYKVPVLDLLVGDESFDVRTDDLSVTVGYWPDPSTPERLVGRPENLRYLAHLVFGEENMGASNFASLVSPGKRVSYRETYEGGAADYLRTVKMVGEGKSWVRPDKMLAENLSMWAVDIKYYQRIHGDSVSATLLLRIINHYIKNNPMTDLSGYEGRVRRQGERLLAYAQRRRAS